MKLGALALAACLAMSNAAHAVNNLGLTDTKYLGAFGAPTNYSDAFAVASPGTINHSLAFTILTDLYAGSGVSDIPLDLTYGAFTVSVTNINGLSAQIFDSNDSLYASFMQNGDPDHLTLPAGSFFAVGNYTLKIGGTATGSAGGMYTIGAVTVPVPEAETWGMLLAGLLTLGVHLRQTRIRAGRRAATA